MIGLVAGAVAGLAAAPMLRAAAARHSVPYGEPRWSCGCSATRWWLPPSGVCPRCAMRGGPARYAVELVAAGVGAAVGSAAHWPFVLVLGWAALFAVVLGFVDVAVHRLPDALTLPLALGTAALLPVAAQLAHRPGVLTRALIAALLLGALYGGMALVAPMGLGDAKLAPTLGGLLAWYGWRTVVDGVFAGFLCGALWGWRCCSRAGRRAGTRCRSDPACCSARWWRCSPRADGT